MSKVNISMKSVPRSENGVEKVASINQMRNRHKEYRESIEKVKLSNKIMRTTLKATPVIDKPTSNGNTTRKSVEGAKSKSSSGNSTGRSIESISTSPPLNLTLYGSAVPICLQRPAPPKKIRLPQPPNSPSEYQPKPSLTLPVENILLLNEKLTSQSSQKIKVSLSSRQIKLSDDYKEVSSCTIEDDLSTSLSSSRPINFSIDLSSVTNSEDDSDSSSEENSKYENTGVSCYSLPDKRPTPETSETSSAWSHSPVQCVWRDNRSERSSNGGYWCEPCHETRPDSRAKTFTWELGSRRSSNFTYSEYSGYVDNFSNDDHSEYSCVCESDMLLCNSSPGCCYDTWRRPNTATSETFQPSSAHDQHRARSADLICVYVNTVKNSRRLSKYFRVCSSCNEPCCVCPETELQSRLSDVLTLTEDDGRKSPFSVSAWKDTCSEGDKCSLAKMRSESAPGKLNLKTYRKMERDPFEDDSSVSYSYSSKHTNLQSSSEYFNCNPVKDVNTYEQDITPFQCQKTQDDKADTNISPNSTCSGFSEFLWERGQLPDQNHRNNEIEFGTEYLPSSLKTQDHNDVSEKKLENNNVLEKEHTNDTTKRSIPVSVSQLATAAHCARILADSLEAVLETVNQETVLEKEIIDSKSVSLLEEYLKKLQSNDMIEIMSKVGLKEENKETNGEASCSSNSNELSVTDDKCFDDHLESEVKMELEEKF